MKAILKFFSLLLIYLFKINSQLTELQREFLLNKVTTVFNVGSNRDDLNLVKDKFFEKTNRSIIYVINKINSIIDKYNFPKTYNFIEDTGATVHIKNKNLVEVVGLFLQLLHYPIGIIKLE